MKGTCYKYFDSQAEGLIAGHVSDYVIGGMFETPVEFNNFAKSITRHRTRIDRYVDEIAQNERASIISVDEISKNMLVNLNITVASGASSDDLRNSVISIASKRAAITVEELQAMSTTRILQILEAAI